MHIHVQCVSVSRSYLAQYPSFLFHCSMAYLLVVSLIWAFSFGLIKDNLHGLDASFVSFVRMAFSLAVFLPFLHLRGITRDRAMKLMLLGAVQFGLMYVLYVASFKTLAAHQVALYACMTPIFVVALEDAAERRFRPRFAFAALLAVGGAVVLGTGILGAPEAWRGFLLVQGSNVCFAIGQVWYRRLGSGPGAVHSEFALPYVGALIVTFAAVVLSPDSVPATLTFRQVATLGYLGLLASGLCFFLWNLGATRTNAGVLAVFNNVKVPLGVFVSLVVFGESANWVRLVIAGTMIAVAFWIGTKSGVKMAENAG